jgi:hypothetical protein
MPAAAPQSPKPDPAIRFLPSANAAVVSAHTRAIIRDLLIASDCPSCWITSTSRTPADQARAMYRNIVALGVPAQLALYADAGDAVIDAYVLARKARLDESAILAAMTAKIVAVGPSKVSLHCADPSRLNVVDIAPSSIQDPRAFAAAIARAKKAGRISRFFTPGTHDPAFHIEVPQP